MTESEDNAPKEPEYTADEQTVAKDDAKITPAWVEGYDIQTQASQYFRFDS